MTLHFRYYTMSNFKYPRLYTVYIHRIKLEIQTFTTSFCSYRFTFYETSFNESVAIVREEKSDDEWGVKNSISVPKDIFSLLKSKSVRPIIVSSVGTVGLAEENFRVRTNADRFDLPVSVRKVFPFRLSRDTPIREPVGIYVDLRNVRVALGDS